MTSKHKLSDGAAPACIRHGSAFAGVNGAFITLVSSLPSLNEVGIRSDLVDEPPELASMSKASFINRRTAV